jgi:hypothetical protein
LTYGIGAAPPAYITKPFGDNVVTCSIRIMSFRSVQFLVFPYPVLNLIIPDRKGGFLRIQGGLSGVAGKARVLYAAMGVA